MMINNRKIFSVSILTIIIGIIIVFAAGFAGDETCPLEKNKSLAQFWNDEVWNKGNLAVIDSLLAPDFVFNYAPPGMEPNRESFKQMVTMNRSVFADLNITLEDIIAEGDKVAVRWNGTSIHKGEYMGVAPTGKQIKMSGITILNIVDGKIVEEWTEMDMMGMMMQLGVIPPPEQAKE